MMVSVEGAYDIHVHSHPCLIPRITDDRGVVTAAKEAGMAGIMLKCHHESTVSRARALDMEFDGIRVFGGIVLNYHVGGINPQAVEAALRMGAKEVWMPTIDAENHARAHGARGVYDVQSSDPQANSTAGGISILKEGKLTSETLEVIKLVAKYNAILGTCHLSKEEMFELIRVAKKEGVNKILITHPFFKVPNLKLEEVEELVAMGGIAEFGFCTVSPMWAYATIDKIYGSIKKLGVANCILMSDAGQRHNPLPHESLRVFAQCLYEKGLNEKEIRQLIVDNPHKLLEE